VRDIEVEIRCATIRMDADEIAAHSKDADQLSYTAETLRRALANIEAAQSSLLTKQAA
jgi:hypothetical protein